MIGYLLDERILTGYLVEPRKRGLKGSVVRRPVGDDPFKEKILDMNPGCNVCWVHGDEWIVVLTSR